MQSARLKPLTPSLAIFVTFPGPSLTREIWDLSSGNTRPKRESVQGEVSASGVYFSSKHGGR